MLSSARFDPARSVLAGLAALMAAATAFLDVNDLSMQFQQLALPALALAGVFAAALALLPGARPWSHGRREAAGIGAIAWAVIGLVISPLAIAATGCACSSGGQTYVTPELLGLYARDWYMATIAGGPLLLVIAASSLPDLLRARLTR